MFIRGGSYSVFLVLLPTLLDSTLREGELYRRFGLDTRIRIAELLAEAGVRRVELTVDYPPKTSREDVEKVVEVLRSYSTEIIIHGRAYKRDVEAAAAYDVDGVGVYLAPTKLHREYKLGGIGYREAVRRLAEAIELAEELGFKYRRATVEDASRFYVEKGMAGIMELASLVDELGDAGATLVSIPDTSGLLTPYSTRILFKELVERCRIPLAAHFHDDYGQASANTIEAALLGVGEIHVTILGIGDRNGIADLYEVAATLRDLHGLDLGIKREKLSELYRKFSRLTGVKIPFKHPLSEEAKTLRAGVHQSMAVKKPEGYIPTWKLRYDFGGASFEATPYMSRKLIQTIIGEEISREEAERIAENLAREAVRKRGRLTARRVKEILEKMGYGVREERLNSIFGYERAYILLNLDPRYPVQEILERFTEWEDVEQVDEVYGDADLVITAKIKPGESVVERLKREFGEALEKVRILITD